LIAAVICKLAVEVGMSVEKDRETGGGTVTDALDEKLGEMTSLYCSVCEEERTFVWVVWSGVEFFGYPPEQEYGWECASCGSRVRVP